MAKKQKSKKKVAKPVAAPAPEFGKTPEQPPKGDAPNRKPEDPAAVPPREKV